jgi:hypothetical protein
MTAFGRFQRLGERCVAHGCAASRQHRNTLRTATIDAQGADQRRQNTDIDPPMERSKGGRLDHSATISIGA